MIKIVHVNLIGVAEKFATLSDTELGIARLELMQMCDDLQSGDAVLAPDTLPESLLALSMMLVHEVAERGRHAF